MEPDIRGRDSIASHGCVVLLYMPKCIYVRLQKCPEETKQKQNKTIIIIIIIFIILISIIIIIIITIVIIIIITICHCPA